MFKPHPIHPNMYSCEPYWHTYKCYAKQRWVGMTIFELMSTEFMLYTPEYYKKAMEDGMITINDQPCQDDDVIIDGDIIRHKTFNTEPYIGDISLIQLYNIKNWEITDEKSDLMAVYKPCNIPIHQSGAYNRNTLISAIKDKFGMTVAPLHRLDRLTSGMMLVSNTPKVHQHLFAENKLQKEYYCLVKGEIEWNERVVNKGISTYCGKRGLMTLDDAGKQSETKFIKVVTFNGSTLLKAYPYTGRTHQIRLHCVHIGHPIINDPIYKNGLPNPNEWYSRNNDDITQDSELYLHANAYALDGKSITCPQVPYWVSDFLSNAQQSKSD